jgi:hypothetical protein
MFGQRQQPARHRVARGFGARTEEQVEEQVDLGVTDVGVATTESMSSVGEARFDAMSSLP